MTPQLTFGSLFSGAGGCDLGFERAGVECRWQCEIDPQASSVLARHWPKVKRHADIQTMTKKDAKKVDIVVGGFPCQGLSIAGKRGGLKDERSGLYYELLRVVGLCRPRCVVWENVPGLLSNDDGRDFGRVLRGLADCGYFGAWRVLDAQFFGAAQRRKRVFGVFLSGRSGGLRAAEILALTQSVRRHPPKGKKAKEDVAFTLTGSVGRSSEGSRIGNAWNTNFIAGTLTARSKEKGGTNARDEAGLVPARCLTSRGERYDADSDNLIAHTLTGVEPDASEDGTGRRTPLVAFSMKDHGADVGELSPTLRAGGHHKSHANGGVMPAISGPMGVRRLTPRECERLMTWPDDHTRYGADGEEFADGPRYRTCGNGVVANVAEWLARRVKAGLTA